MDLNDINIPETADVVLRHPATREALKDDDGKPCVITVHGPATDEAVALQRKARQRLMKRIGPKGLQPMTGEEAEEAEIERLVAMTAKVSGLKMNGDPVTKKNIDAVYRDPKYGWLREQVAERLGGWEDFLA